MFTVDTLKCIVCDVVHNDTYDVCDKCIESICVTVNTTNDDIDVDMITDQEANCSEFDNIDFDLFEFILDDVTEIKENIVAHNTITWTVQEDSDSDSDSE